MVCEPIFKKLKKGVNLEWDEKCQEEFDKIKGYLSNPLVLAPQPSIPLILYLTTTTIVIGAMLAQKVGEERAIYYLIKKISSIWNSLLLGKNLSSISLGMQKTEALHVNSYSAYIGTNGPNNPISYLL